MPVMLEQLVAWIQVKGADRAERDIQRVRNEVAGLGNVLQEIGTLGGITYLLSQVADLSRSLGAISGVNAAAQFGSMEYKLRALVGTGERYRDLLRDIRKMGGDPLMMGNIAAQMVSSGVGVDRVGKDLQKLRDATAAGGARGSDMNDILFNILQIRSAQGERADFTDIREMLSRAPGMSRVLAAGLGVKQADVMGKLKAGMSGSEVYDALLKGAGAPGIAGSARRAEYEDPLQAWDALMRDMKEIMVPTGRVILEVFRPIGAVMRVVADALGDINERSGGIFGLAGLIGGGLLIATRAASTELWKMVTALGAVAGGAKTAGGTAAVAGGTAAIGAGAAAAGAGAAGIGARLSGFLGKFLNGAGIAGIISGLGSIVGSFVGGDGSGTRGRIGDIIKDITMGAGLGAGVGSFYGPQGAILGGILGGIGGGIYNGIFGGKGEGGTDNISSPEKEIARNTRRIADQLDRGIQVYGGGPRTASAVSRFEAEVAFANALAF
jgi:hypothetical protein